ncbi:MAG: D-amino-acid transaminase [Ostreibacterium sp.]
MRICFLNGEFIREDQATVSVFDRGFLFSDGVYEVSLVLNGQLVDNLGHLARLSRSLEKIGIKIPYTSKEIIKLQKQLIAKNNLQNGGLYLQVTRGNDGDRDFMPATNTQPTFLLIPQHNDIINNPLATCGAKIMSFPEIRWAKRDIKSVGLLAAVLAKKSAKEQGFDDAWFVENGYVTEGSSNNAYIIKNKKIITKKANEQILNGITRQSLFHLADEQNLTILEREFTIEEAQQADESFISSATMLIAPVINIDGIEIADGKPGKFTTLLRKTYIETALNNLLP